MRCMRSIVMAIPLVLLAVLALPAGCATRQIAFEKPGAARAERQQDEGACLREAIGTDTSDRILLSYQIDREVFTKCMEARGYAQAK